MKNYKQLQIAANKAQRRYLKHKKHLLNSAVVVLFIILIALIFRQPFLVFGKVVIPLFALALIPLALGIDCALLRAKSRLASNLADSTMQQIKSDHAAMQQRLTEFASTFFYYELANGVKNTITFDHQNAPLSFNKSPMMWMNYKTNSHQLTVSFGPTAQECIEPAMAGSMHFKVGEDDITPVSPSPFGELRQYLLFNNLRIDRMSYLPKQGLMMLYDDSTKQLKEYHFPTERDDD